MLSKHRAKLLTGPAEAQQTELQTLVGGEVYLSAGFFQSRALAHIARQVCL